MSLWLRHNTKHLTQFSIGIHARLRCAETFCFSDSICWLLGHYIEFCYLSDAESVDACSAACYDAFLWLRLLAYTIWYAEVWYLFDTVCWLLDYNVLKFDAFLIAITLRHREVWYFCDIYLLVPKVLKSNACINLSASYQQYWCAHIEDQIPASEKIMLKKKASTWKFKIHITNLISALRVYPKCHNVLQY